MCWPPRGCMPLRRLSGACCWVRRGCRVPLLPVELLLRPRDTFPSHPLSRGPRRSLPLSNAAVFVSPDQARRVGLGTAAMTSIPINVVRSSTNKPPPPPPRLTAAQRRDQKGMLHDSSHPWKRGSHVAGRRKRDNELL
jgi:hypothetical protein